MVQWYTTLQNLFVSLNEFKILYQNKKTIIASYVIFKLQVYYHSFISWYTRPGSKSQKIPPFFPHTELDTNHNLKGSLHIPYHGNT